MTVDWTKPIRFENGERCKLVGTNSGGFGQFKDCTRAVERLDEESYYCRVWYYRESGKSHWPGYNVVNAEGDDAAAR